MRALKDVRVTTKVLVATLAMAALTVAVGLYSLYEARAINARAAEIRS